MITLDEYFQGREQSKKYRVEFSALIFKNAKDLVERVNGLLQELRGDEHFTITSGWRPASYNKEVGGAKNSWHIVGKAIDIADRATLDIEISDRPDLLSKFGLWQEDPNFTPGWVHLDTGVRPDRLKRIFKPR